MMLLFAGIGASLAFVPIEGRPMDLMISNFAKTIPNENRYIYRKRGVSIANFEVLTPPNTAATTTTASATPTQQASSNSKKVLLERRLRDTTFKPDDQEAKFINNINSIFDTGQAATQPVATTASIPQATAIVETPQAVVPEPEKPKDTPVVFQAPAVPDPKKETTPPPAPTVDIQQQTTQAQEFQFNQAKENPVQQAPENNPTGTTTQTAMPQVGFPSLPDVGNVVMGTVCDPRGKTLPNVLVEVIDENNIPVRAFKTNALGQFASATPLPNGSYKMVFDDPQKNHDFQEVSIELNGSIFMPLQIMSVDAREKLRRELFGGGQAVQAA